MKTVLDGSHIDLHVCCTCNHNEQRAVKLLTQEGPVHTRPEKFKNATITGHCTCDFVKPLFQNVFRLQEMQRRRFQIPPGLKNVFEKLRFRDGLVWTVGLTVERKLRFGAD